MYFESIQWSHPSSTLLSGPSNSGKTSLLTKILKNRDNLFTGSKKQTILFYNHWQPIYDEWVSSSLIAYSHQGVPNIEDFKSLCSYYTLEDGVFVVFDDLGSQILRNIEFFEELFVVLSHHMRISIFLVIHNLFEKGLRKISLNSNRIILTNNCRDISQISFFARQCFPGSSNFLPSVYNFICNLQPYGYLVLDFCQNKNRYLKVTSNWFGDQTCIMSFSENNIKCTTEEKKSFNCYHLVPSSIFDLLTKNHQSHQQQNTNIINNSTSYIPPTQNNIYRSDPTPLRMIDNKVKRSQTKIDSSKRSQQKDKTGVQTLSLGVDQINQTEINLDKSSFSQTENLGSDQGNQTDSEKLIPVNSQVTNTVNRRGVKKQRSKISKKGLKNTHKGVNDDVPNGNIKSNNVKQSLKFELDNIPNGNTLNNDVDHIQKNDNVNIPIGINDIKPYLTPTNSSDKRKVKIEKKKKSQSNLSKILKKQKKPVDLKEINKRISKNQFQTPLKIPSFAKIFKNKKIKNITPQSDLKNIQVLSTPILDSGDSLKTKFDKKAVKRNQKAKIKTILPPKRFKVNRGEKRVLQTPDEGGVKLKKQKAYNIIRNNYDYETWRL